MCFHLLSDGLILYPPPKESRPQCLNICPDADIMNKNNRVFKHQHRYVPTSGLLRKTVHLRSRLSFKPAVSVGFAGFQNRDICLLWAFPMSRFVTVLVNPDRPLPVCDPSVPYPRTQESVRGQLRQQLTHLSSPRCKRQRESLSYW